MTPDFSPEDELALAGRLADAAWSAIRPHFRELSSVDNKGAPGARYDPVTEADRAAERAMRAVIEAERPHHGITGEEYGETASASGWRWLLDPVDGTRAFVAGLPVWTTLIALVDPEDRPVLGVIDQPVLGERYLGWPGGAALETASGRTPLKASACPSLADAVIATTDPYILTDPEHRAWTGLRSTARIARYGLDAYAYARLAGGTLDLVAETGLKPWDVGALIPVVTGAGGLATDWAGNPARLGGQILCTASEALLEDALRLVKPAAS
ncbi:MAG TPA: histidinol-phosphatase [Hyphomonas sp.]|nr:histidinol-phosphatase [Hyphomonas sp.]MCB9972605.1 histidinol-phosphatase [Hyphomonas sp.]HPE49293.1 histidinol-phosphatase [Hyphomonas sp.]